MAVTLKNADPELQEVIASIYRKYASDYLQTYSGIEEDTGLPIKTIRKYVDILKKLGYVKVSAGFDDEGLLRGRGFWIVREKEAEVDLLVELMEARK